MTVGKENVYRFVDSHPTGGSSLVTIREVDVIKYMRQFLEYDVAICPDSKCIKDCTQARNAFLVPGEDHEVLRKQACTNPNCKCRSKDNTSATPNVSEVVQ